MAASLPQKILEPPQKNTEDGGGVNQTALAVGIPLGLMVVLLGVALFVVWNRAGDRVPFENPLGQMEYDDAHTFSPSKPPVSVRGFTPLPFEKQESILSSQLQALYARGSPRSFLGSPPLPPSPQDDVVSPLAWNGTHPQALLARGARSSLLPLSPLFDGFPHDDNGGSTPLPPSPQNIDDAQIARLQLQAVEARRGSLLLPQEPSDARAYDNMANLMYDRAGQIDVASAGNGRSGGPLPGATAAAAAAAAEFVDPLPRQPQQGFRRKPSVYIGHDPGAVDADGGDGNTVAMRPIRPPSSKPKGFKRKPSVYIGHDPGAVDADGGDGNTVAMRPIRPPSSKPKGFKRKPSLYIGHDAGAADADGDGVDNGSRPGAVDPYSFLSYTGVGKMNGPGAGTEDVEAEQVLTAHAAETALDRIYRYQFGRRGRAPDQQ